MKDIFKSTKVRISLLCILIAVAGIYVGRASKQPRVIPTIGEGEEVIATIDGKEFTANELYAELKKQGGNDVLVNLVDEYIASKELEDDSEALDYAKSYVTSIKSQYEAYGEDFAAALKSAGYANEDELVEVIRKDYLKELVAGEFIKNTENGFITEKELKKYYEENIFGDMQVRYILLAPKEVDSDDAEYATKTAENEAEALARANEVIAKLKNGDKFSDLAKEYSDDSSTASEGGLFSGFTKSDVVEEFWNACVELEDGKYTTTPVKSSYGYFVIYRVKQEEKPALEDVKDECLESILTTKKSEDSDIITKAWVKIRKNYNLDIIDSEVSKSYSDKIKDYE